MHPVKRLLVEAEIWSVVAFAMTLTDDPDGLPRTNAELRRAAEIWTEARCDEIGASFAAIWEKWREVFAEQDMLHEQSKTA